MLKFSVKLIIHQAGWLVAVAAPGVMLNNVSVRCQARAASQLTLHTHNRDLKMVPSRTLE